MAKSALNGPDDARFVTTGTLGGLGRGAPSPAFVLGAERANVDVDCATGSFVGTYRFVRSFNGGATWRPTTSAGVPITFTADVSEVVQGAEAGELLDIEVSAYTSGALTYRLSR